MTAVGGSAQEGTRAAPAASTATAVRRTDIDALRILVCACVIFAHATLIFAAEPFYHLKSPQPDLSATVVYEFLRISTMPIFFVIAGWAALRSVRSRTPIAFLQDRVIRLLVPLIVGIFAFGPGIKYIELSQGRDIGVRGLRSIEPLQAGFFEFLPHYLTKSVLMTWSHLWFLCYLFLISVLLLPLLMRLARAAPWSGAPNALVVYLPALALAAQLVVFNGYWPFVPSLINDGANFAYFTLCFAIGIGMAVWPDFEVRLHVEAPRLLALMLLAFAGVILCGESALGRMFVGLTAWGAIGAGLGYVARLNIPTGRSFAYLVDATMPVYVIHHLPLLLIGVAVLPLPLPVWVKIAIIFVGAATISLAAYHWLVRRSKLLRWLMGMGAQKKPVPRPNAQEA